MVGWHKNVSFPQFRVNLFTADEMTWDLVYVKQTLVFDNLTLRQTDRFLEWNLTCAT